MGAYQSIKLSLIETLHLAKDALHIYVALIVFFTVAFFVRRGVRSWIPWAVVLGFALAGEAWDLRDSYAYGTPVDLWANWKDIWNTMFWPTVILLLARNTGLFYKDEVGEE